MMKTTILTARTKNNSLNIFEEMKIITFLKKHPPGDAFSI